MCAWCGQVPDSDLLRGIMAGFREYARKPIKPHHKQAKPTAAAPWTLHGILGHGGEHFHEKETIYTQFSTPYMPGAGTREWISFHFKNVDTQKVLYFTCHMCLTSNTTSSDRRGCTARQGEDSHTFQWKWDNAYGSNIVHHIKTLQHHATFLSYHKGALGNMKFMADSLKRVPATDVGGDPLAHMGGQLTQLHKAYSDLKKYVSWREELVKEADRGKAWDMCDVMTDPQSMPATIATLSRCDASRVPSCDHGGAEDAENVY